MAEIICLIGVGLTMPDGLGAGTLDLVVTFEAVVAILVVGGAISEDEDDETVWVGAIDEEEDELGAVGGELLPPRIILNFERPV